VSIEYGNSARPAHVACALASERLGNSLQILSPCASSSKFVCEVVECDVVEFGEVECSGGIIMPLPITTSNVDPFSRARNAREEGTQRCRLVEGIVLFNLHC
jgi:hypothetical protein